MPIFNTRDLIPFVNQLEAYILNMNSSIAEWDREKYKLQNSASKADSNFQTAMSALVKADEALAEVGTATFKSTAIRGKRLEDTLNKLRNEMYEIAANSEGGGGSLKEGMFFDELNNAIASTDVTIEDGLKLDYRLREITDLAKKGAGLNDKPLHMPYKYQLEEVSDELTLSKEEGVTFLDADVTVLNANGEPFLDDFGKIITARMDTEGNVTFSSPLEEPVTLYFPVKMRLEEVPEDFLYLYMEQIIQKNSRMMEIVLNTEKIIQKISDDMELMKGVQWTPDFSIMRNHQDVVKEGITPKGLNVDVKDGMAHVTFSHNDHPYLSHFILEKWDESKKQFVPYDGVNGIVQK